MSNRHILSQCCWLMMTGTAALSVGLVLFQNALFCGPTCFQTQTIPIVVWVKVQNSFCAVVCGSRAEEVDWNFFFLVHRELLSILIPTKRALPSNFCTSYQNKFIPIHKESLHAMHLHLLFLLLYENRRPS